MSDVSNVVGGGKEELVVKVTRVVKLSPREQRIGELRDEGLTYKEIAELVGCWQTEVYKALAKAGRTKSQGARMGNAPSVDAETIVELRKAGRTYMQIANETGASTVRIAKVLNRAGMTTPRS